MELKNNKEAPKKETAKSDTSSEIKTTSIYDDDNIPEIDTKAFIQDQIPRKDELNGE